MKDIFELIDIMRERTAMYTSENKLSNIRAFIDGYYFALSKMDCEKDFLGKFEKFHDWVVKKYGFVESTSGWNNMILAVEMGLNPENIDRNEYLNMVATKQQHDASVQQFFELLNEYRKCA